jgi:hypothetical protein
MKALKLLLIYCLLLSTFTACNTKEEDADLKPTASSKTDYLPTTVGSHWTYGGRLPYTLSVTGAKKDINNKTYYELETVYGTTANKIYVAKEKGIYKTIGLINGMGDLDIMTLNEATTVGQSWGQTGNVNGFDVNLTLTVEEVGITKTIAGHIYEKVINIKIKSNHTYMGADTGINYTTNYYFAQGVGLILIDLGKNGQVPLLDYTVNE